MLYEGLTSLELHIVGRRVNPGYQALSFHWHRAQPTSHRTRDSASSGPSLLMTVADALSRSALSRLVACYSTASSELHLFAWRVHPSANRLLFVLSSLSSLYNSVARPGVDTLVDPDNPRRTFSITPLLVLPLAGLTFALRGY